MNPIKPPELVESPVEVASPWTAERLQSLLNDARLFDAQLYRWRMCEAADAELDAGKRLEARRKIVSDASLWARQVLTASEVDLLYGMARELARIALAQRTVSFRVEYGITLTCGEPPSA